MKYSLILIFVLALGCTPKGSRISSSVNSSTKDTIYSWAEDENIAALRDNTEVKIAGEDQIIVAPAQLSNKTQQYALRGFVSGEGVYLVQLYTISAFSKPLSEQDEWPNLDTATRNEKVLDVIKITGEIKCTEACDFYEHLSVNFSHREIIEIATLDQALELTVKGHDETKEYSIPNYYLKGFVLTLQEFLDEKIEVYELQNPFMKMENLFLEH